MLGHDPAKRELDLKRRIGIVLQSTGVDPYLTVRETVELYAGYYPKPRDIDEVIHVVGLEEKRDARVDKLSGGQQRRLDVAIGLAGDPELLFLDEPTTGFDPSARRHAWDMVKGLTALGKTVFLTTHFMDEAQFLAGRVAVISHGQIVAEGPPSTLGGRDTMQTVIRFRLAGEVDGGPPMGQVATDRRDVRGPCGRPHEGAARADELGARPRHAVRARGGHAANVGGRLPPAHRRRARDGMSAAGLTLRQVRFTNKSFWRNPASAFFTFAFPLMFLVIFTALLGGGDVRIKGTDLRQTTYYVVAMASFGVISRLLHEHRDQRVLQPRRGDPEAHPRNAAPRLVVPVAAA